MMHEEPFIYKYETFKDSRGSFSAVFNEKDFSEKLGREIHFIQDNIAHNGKKFTFRGLHWQDPPYAQAKLVRCVSGSIIDIIVDIRKGPTYGKPYLFWLSGSENQWLYVPRGFAHGYLTLLDNTDVEYKVDNFYAKDFEMGMLFADTVVAKLYPDIPIVSEKDFTWPEFKDIHSNFEYEFNDIDEQ